MNHKLYTLPPIALHTSPPANIEDVHAGGKHVGERVVLDVGAPRQCGQRKPLHKWTIQVRVDNFGSKWCFLRQDELTFAQEFVKESVKEYVKEFVSL